MAMSNSTALKKGEAHSGPAYYGQGEHYDTTAWSDGDGEILLANDLSGRAGALEGGSLVTTEDFILGLADRIRESANEQDTTENDE